MAQIILAINERPYDIPLEYRDLWLAEHAAWSYSELQAQVFLTVCLLRLLPSQAGRRSAPTTAAAVKKAPIVVKAISVAVLRPELQPHLITPRFHINGVGTVISYEQKEIFNYLKQRNAEL